MDGINKSPSPGRVQARGFCVRRRLAEPPVECCLFCSARAYVPTCTQMPHNSEPWPEIMHQHEQFA